MIIPRQHWLLLCALSLVSLTLISCSSGYGPPYGTDKLGSARVAQDGRSVIFSYRHERYKPAAGWRTFPDGGAGKHLEDSRHLLVMDVESGKVRLLKSYDNRDRAWLPGTWDVSVYEAMGERAILNVAGQSSGKGGKKFELVREKMWLDLTTGVTSSLPLSEELAARGHELKFFYLVDSDGTLVVVSHPADNDAKYLWLRTSDGTLHDLGPIVDYYGYRDGEVHFYHPDNIYLIRTPSGKVRKGAYKEYLSILDHQQSITPPNAAVQLTVDSSANGNLTVTAEGKERVVTAEEVKRVVERGE
jgi:hypothetical protein